MDEFRELTVDIKEIRKDVAEIKRDTAINTVSLTQHMQRTAANERRIETVEKWVIGLLMAIVAAACKSAFF